MDKQMKNSRRIFLIGFNKCGTTSFHSYFKRNEISSIHWRANTLAMKIKSNHEKKIKLLEGIDNWSAYTDLICIPGTPWGKSNSDNFPVIEAGKYFKELHADYPDSLFILNTRDPFKWIKSRLKHDDGKFAKAYLKALEPLGILNKQQLERKWLHDWHEHHYNVIDYFEKYGPKQFLLFHISESPSRLLNKFLQPHFKINHEEFPHHHKSQ